jgi:hypothetical protein
MRTIRVGQGLFVLRYVSSKAGRGAPMLAVSAAPTSGVELIWPGAETGGYLVVPGDAMVVRASRDSFITIAVTPSEHNGSCEAELVLERVSAGQSPQRDGTSPVGSAALDGIEILAHVARRGDVLVPAGRWICGPDVPMAIEGIEIRWPARPHGIDIVGRATSTARSAAPAEERRTGFFLGSRGRAAPLTSLALSLVGPDADRFLLSCEALFLGLPVMTVSGRSCVLRGTTGTEPLVGLRLSVDAAAAPAQPVRQDVAITVDPRQQSAGLPIPSAPVAKPGRVRIFRSSKVRSSGAYSLAK